MEAAAEAGRPGSVGRVGSEDPGAAQRRPGPLLRHPIPVVLVATSLWGLALTTYSSVGKGAIAALMAVVLVVLAAIDLEHRIIPNAIVLPATAIVLFANAVVVPGRAVGFVLAGLGAGLVFAIPSLINRSWMGMGDVKLAAFLGAGLGASVFAAVTVAFMGVFPVALLTIIRGGFAARKATLPFGPFLAFGGLVTLFLPHLLQLGGG